MCDDVEPNFDAMNDGVEPVMIDLTDVFTTGMLFDTRDELLKWARNVGRENGIVVVIFRSETATARPRTKTKLILGCERSGKYRPWKNPNLTRSTWTRKCDCPFRLRGTRSSVGDGWYLHVICGLHNHELAKKLTGHSFLGRLSQDEKNVYLKSYSPIPPASNLWKNYCNEEARQWEFIYGDRMQHWLQIFPETINEVIVN
ncbi:uncharacterized protein [Cicer arietinum]|uniref:uncharacterized protein n=1 Tax=Cicer arietinum TaxID=3827 RepID=UPI00032A8E7C